jgi:subtilisin family serine protease
VLLLLLPDSVMLAADVRHLPGQILVKTRANVPEADFAKRLRDHGAHYQKTLRHLNMHVINVPESMAESVLASLRRDSSIEFAERDGVASAAFVPNDSYVSSGAEWHLEKIRAPQAWDMTVGATNTVIAILDSGINASHPEVAGRILPGYNFVSGTSDTSDDFGHGTAVAGTVIAAGNNGIGVAGVAFACSVLPVKVVDSSGFASYSAVADGIRFAVERGAHVINLSIAGSSPSSTLQAAVDYAWSNNVVVIAAAGNNATSEPQYPAACNHVIGVSATTVDDSIASFSSYGAYVSLAAPGDNIWTLQRDLSNPYGSWRGTSFSSPIVAAVAALVKSVNPSLSSAQVTSVLEQTADDTGAPGEDVLFGRGRVNASLAVLAAAALPGAQPNSNTPPSNPVFPPPPDSQPSATTASVTVQITGLGRVTPNLNGRVLSAGQVVNLRAIPGSGQVFAGWDGLSAFSALPNLQFVLKSNVTFVARFVPSPYLGLKGTYAGLLANTNGVSPADSGYFNVTVNSSGTFSGRVLINGSRYGLHGQFNAFGDAVVNIRRGQAASLVLSLHLDLAGGSDQITGQITDGAWVSELSGDRNVFNSRWNPAQQAGIQSFLLEQSGDTALTAGTGSSRISQGGSTRVRGKLADLRSFSASSTLAKNGDFPFYISFNRGSEVIIGWLNFPANHAPSSRGTVVWVKSGTNSFAKSLKVNALQVDR